MTVDLPALAALAGPALTSPAGEPPRGTRWTAQHTAGVVTLGVGGVALVVGSITGAMTLSTWSDAEAHCSTGSEPLTCDAEGQSLSDDAHGMATVSTIAFVAGGLLVVGGAVIFFTSANGGDGTSASVAPWFGPGVGGGALRGRF